MSLTTNKKLQSKEEQRFPDWTGLNGKTLVDLLNLAGVVAVPLLIAVIGSVQWWVAHQRSVQEERLAEDRGYQEVMSKYLEQMTKLQIEYKSLASFSSQANASQRDKVQGEIGLMARAITLNAARQLDGERKGQLLKFLYESDLIGGQCTLDPQTGQPVGCKNDGLLQLDGAKLRDINNDPDVPLYLPGSDLSQAHLHNARLSNVNLANANMVAIRLQNSDLSKATLSDALMVGAVMEGANLTCANLARTVLPGANLKNADFDRVDLQGANLTNLKEVDWAGASFKGAVYDNKTELPDGFNKKEQGMLPATEETLAERKELCSEGEGRLQSWLSKIPKF